LNKLTLNLEKTNYLVLQTPQNKRKLNLNSIKIGDSYLKETNSIKFLGVEIDKSLSWNLHTLRFHYRIMRMDFLIRLMETVTSNETATIS